MTNRKPDITIIILHFGKLEITKQCLESLAKIKHSNFKYKVLVLNNSSENLDLPKNTDLLVNSSENLGFAIGNNHGVEVSKHDKWHSDYFLFLNNDTIVESNFLEELVNFLEKNQSYAIAGPVIEHKVKNQTFYDYGGFVNWKRGQPKHINKTKYNKNEKAADREFVSGCCLLIRSNIFDKIGGFNRDYFLYLEDVDLCLKTLELGKKIALVPSSKIFHLGSQSSTELTKIFYSWRNSFYLTNKFVPLKYKFTAILFNLFFYPMLFLLWQFRRIEEKIIHK